MKKTKNSNLYFTILGVIFSVFLHQIAFAKSYNSNNNLMFPVEIWAFKLQMDITGIWNKTEHEIISGIDLNKNYLFKNKVFTKKSLKPSIGNFSNNISFTDCIFLKPFELNGLKFEKGLTINKCCLINGLKFQNLNIGVSVKMTTPSTEKEPDVEQLKISSSKIGNLQIDRIYGENNSDNIFIIWDTVFGTTNLSHLSNLKLNIQNSVFHEGCVISNCISKSVVIDNNTFIKEFCVQGQSNLNSSVFKNNNYKAIAKYKEITLYKPTFTNETFHGITEFKYDTMYNCNFDTIVFKKPVSFKRSIFDSITDFSEDVHFESTVTFDHTTFNGLVDFSNVKFDSTVTFDSVTFNGLVDFSHASFEDSVIFNKCIFNDSSSFNKCTFDKVCHFRNCFFSDTSKINFTEATINLLSFEYDTTLPSELCFYKAKILNQAKIFKPDTLETRDTVCYINLNNEYVDKFSFFYHDFKLCIPDKSFHQHRVYNQLLKKYKDDGMLHCHELLNKEYQEYCFKHDHYNGGTHPLNSFGFLQELFGELLNTLHNYWWGYAYEKERILIWTILFLFIFSYINIFFGKKIFSKIYPKKNGKQSSKGKVSEIILSFNKLIPDNKCRINCERKIDDPNKDDSKKWKLKGWKYLIVSIPILILLISISIFKQANNIISIGIIIIVLIIILFLFASLLTNIWGKIKTWFVNKNRNEENVSKSITFKRLSWVRLYFLLPVIMVVFFLLLSLLMQLFKQTQLEPLIWSSQWIQLNLLDNSNIPIVIYGLFILNMFMLLSFSFYSNFDNWINSFFKCDCAKQYFMNPFVAFYYTARLFFGLSLDLEKINYEENIKSVKGSFGLLFVLIIHLTGLLCVAFLANYILVGGY